jgi:hypothetical protein
MLARAFQRACAGQAAEGCPGDRDGGGGQGWCTRPAPLPAVQHRTAPTRGTVPHTIQMHHSMAPTCMAMALLQHAQRCAGLAVDAARTTSYLCQTCDPPPGELRPHSGRGALACWHPANGAGSLWHNQPATCRYAAPHSTLLLCTMVRRSMMQLPVLASHHPAPHAQLQSAEP